MPESERERALLRLRLREDIAEFFPQRQVYIHLPGDIYISAQEAYKAFVLDEGKKVAVLSAATGEELVQVAAQQYR